MPTFSVATGAITGGGAATFAINSTGTLTLTSATFTQSAIANVTVSGTTGTAMLPITVLGSTGRNLNSLANGQFGNPVIGVDFTYITATSNVTQIVSLANGFTVLPLSVAAPPLIPNGAYQPGSYYYYQNGVAGSGGDVLLLQLHVLMQTAKSVAQLSCPPLSLLRLPYSFLFGGTYFATGMSFTATNASTVLPVVDNAGTLELTPTISGILTIMLQIGTSFVVCSIPTFQSDGILDLKTPRIIQFSTNMPLVSNLWSDVRPPSLTGVTFTTNFTLNSAPLAIGNNSRATSATVVTSSGYSYRQNRTIVVTVGPLAGSISVAGGSSIVYPVSALYFSQGYAYTSTGLTMDTNLGILSGVCRGSQTLGIQALVEGIARSTTLTITALPMPPETITLLQHHAVSVPLSGYFAGFSGTITVGGLPSGLSLSGSSIVGTPIDAENTYEATAICNGVSLPLNIILVSVDTDFDIEITRARTDGTRAYLLDIAITRNSQPFRISGGGSGAGLTVRAVDTVTNGNIDSYVDIVLSGTVHSFDSTIAPFLPGTTFMPFASSGIMLTPKVALLASIRVVSATTLRLPRFYVSLDTTGVILL